jgi:O-antigen ligase
MGRKALKDKKKDSRFWPGLFVVFFGFSLIVLPLIYSEKVMDPTLAPRMIAWTALLLLTTLILFNKTIFRQLDFSVLRNPIFAVFLLLFSLGMGSLLFAINVSAGFYDQVKTFSSLAFLTLACLLFIKTPGWPLRLTKFFIVGSLIILLVGYIQYLTELGFGFHPRHEIIELTGMMSNVNLYANYLMLMTPFIIYGVVTFHTHWRVLSIISLVLSVLMIFLLQTRAVYLAILVGIAAVMVLLILKYKQFGIPASVRKGLTFLLVGGGLAFAGIVIMAPEDNIYVSRMRSIFTDTENPRLLVWGATREMIADHPLTGVGAGNFTINVQDYYGNYTFPENQENWLRPHNDFLWVLSEKGVFGLIAFLMIFALALYYIWSIVRSNTDTSGKILALYIFGGLTAYMVNSFFDFPLERVNHQIILAIYLASIIAMHHQLKSSHKPLPVSRNLFLITLLVPLLTGAKFTYEHIKQEKYVSMARNANASEQWDMMLDAAQRAQTPWKTLDALAVPVYFFEAFAYTQLHDGNKAMHAFAEAYRHNPHRKYITNNLGVLHMQNEQYTTAIKFFEETLHMYPKDIQTLNYLADAFVLTEQYQEALDMLDKIPEEQRTGRLLILYAHVKEQLNKQ